LDINDLPPHIAFPTGHRLPNREEVLPLEELERRAILQAISDAGGDKLAAARLLGIGKTTLYRKLRQYRVE
jgi:two-component system response regulator HydG